MQGITDIELFDNYLNCWEFDAAEKRKTFSSDNTIKFFQWKSYI